MSGAPVVIILSALIMIAASLFLLLRPFFTLEFLQRFIRSMTYRTALLEAAIRIAVGYASLVYADQSQYPYMLKAYGAVLLGQGVLIVFTPIEWHRRFALWAFNFTRPFLRWAPAVTIPVGLILLYAVL